jgi:polyketide synthase PksJ
MNENKIDKQNVEDMMGLTAMQAGMLFHYLANPLSQLYMEQIRLTLSGKINTRQFKEAWKILADSNEMLRSVIGWEKLEEPVQIVLKQKEIPIRVFDLYAQNKQTRETSQETIINNDKNQPLDLTREPFRITLCRCHDHESLMILTFHHILLDGWSTGILLTEFQMVYNRLVNGEPSVPISKTRYKDFFKWYRQSQSRYTRERRQFWKNYLEGFDTRTLLPYDKKKLQDIQRVSTHQVEISSSCGEPLQACALSHNVTISTILYAAWGILLQRYNNSDDIVFGTTVSGRTPLIKGIEQIAGLFINTLPLRLNAGKDTTVSEVFHAIDNHLKERSESKYEHSPLTGIKQLTGVGKESNLFDSIIVIDNYPLDNLLTQQTPGNHLVFRSYDTFEMTNFDLTVQIMVSEADHMRVNFHYNADLFEPGTIQRMAAHYINILQGIITDASVRTADVPMLTDEETKQILEEFNNPAVRLLVEQTIDGVIADRAAAAPSNNAIQYEDRCLTYRELNKQANRLAHMLREYSVNAGCDSRVAVMFPRSLEMIIVLLGILKSGAACIPLDISYPEERNRFIIRDSEAGFLLRPAASMASIPSLTGTMDTATSPGVTEIFYDGEKLEAYPGENPGNPPVPADLSYIIYTSGSTGKPKGALLHHSGIVNHTYTKTHVLDITTADTVANNFSINVIASVWQILSPLFTGARLVVYPGEIEWDPYRQFERAAADGVTIIEVIPSVLKAYLFLLDEGKEKVKLEGLRKIALTTEETKPFLVNKFYERYNHIDLVDCYGQTECCDDVLHYTIPHNTDTQEVPIGTPSLNTNVFILNHHDQLQPVGVAGEICVIGAGVAYGYWKRPELTAERFDQDLKDYRDYRDGYHRSYRSYMSYILYKTGDLGQWLPDGNVKYLGRVDYQVKIRGNRVELREIENHMMGHPLIKEAAVVAKEDKDGDNTLYAFFISDKEINADELRRFLLKTLPDYMVPAHFARMEKMPLTPNGKIDRKVLVKMEIKANIGTSVEYRPPRNDIEKKIQDIWVQLLEGKEKEHIGIDDNFFDLGGHSLLLIKLKSKLEKGFDLKQEIELIELFNYPTIALQARYMEKKVEVKVEEEGVNRKEKRTGTGKEIAVIGISLRVPGAAGIDEFWRNLITGTESICFFDEEELENSRVEDYVKGNCKMVPAGGIIGDIEFFAADFFGFSPREAEIIEPQQRLFLEHAWWALEDAGYGGAGHTCAGDIGVYAGVGLNTYLLNNVMAHPEVVNTLGEFQTMIGNDKDFLATRAAYKLNLKGPAITIQSACSTSLVAIHLARQGLLNGDCDMALVGGVAVHVPEKTGYFYNEGGYLSPDGHCRAFDAGADGTVFGNGIGIVVLKPLTGALEDNDHIYALVKGSAVNNDGSLKVGYTSPGEIGQAKVIARALREAGVSPDTIGYIETHGTGTVLGDPMEMAALKRAFREAAGNGGNGKSKKQYCAVGSVKSNIGHLDIAAGIVGFIKAVLCLKHQQIPPGINVKKTNPMIDFPNTPFYVSRELTDWPLPDNGGRRRAGVSSFGIGGTNAHVILEEWPGGQSAERKAHGEKRTAHHAKPIEQSPPSQGMGAVSPPDQSRRHQLILLSAKTGTALRQIARNLVLHLKQNPELSLADTAYTLTQGRKAFDHRLAVVCRDRTDAIDTLETFNPKRILMHTRTPGEKSIVFMFPGVGEHYVNMAYQLYHQEPVFREHLDRCCDILEPLLEKDLRDILFVEKLKSKKVAEKNIDLRKLLNREQVPLSEEENVLSQTIYSQTSVFVVEYALAKLLMAWGIKPYAMIGYSIGEYTAACLSGVFSLEDALFLVANRARLIHSLENGAMLAVSLPEKEIKSLLEQKQGVSIAAVNTPDLCIVSGKPADIESLEKQLKERKVVFRHLKTFQAFHSPMMEVVRGELTGIFKKVTLHAPTVPYISNVTGTWVTEGLVTTPDYWVTHTVSPIRFSEGISQLLKTSCNFFLEVGPGNSLCGFTAQHPGNETAVDRFILASLPKESENVPGEVFFLRALSKLWAAGLDINRTSFHKYERQYRKRVPLPTYPFERKRYWLEPGTGNAEAKPVRADVKIEKKQHIADWFYIPCWKQSLPPLAAAPGAGKNHENEETWLLFLDESHIGDLLINRLKTHMNLNPQHIFVVKIGQRFETLSEGSDGQEAVYAVNPGQYQDYVALLEALRDQGVSIGKILHLWLWDSPAKEIKAADEADGTREIGSFPERGVYSLLYLVKAMGKLSIFDNMELWMVSKGLHKIENSDTCHPGKAAILGPCKVVTQEYPNIVSRCIDFEENTTASYDEQRIVNHLVSELNSSPLDRMMAYRGFNRWIQSFEPVKLEKGPGVPVILREKGVYIITGGLGNIGFSIARYLAESVHARLVLINRATLPGNDKENPKTMKIRQLEEMGAEVLMVRADVSNNRQMQQAVEQAEEQFGPIHGVLHAAGIMDEKAFKLIADSDRQDCESHFRAKIHGLMVLEEVLRDKELDFCISTSSLSPILGGLSLYAYSAANSFMDAFAHQQALVKGKNWISINWADWHRGEPTGDSCANLLLGSTVSQLNITPGEGQETFKRALSLFRKGRRTPEIVISSGDLHRRLQQWVLPDTGPGPEADADPTAKSKTAVVHKRPRLQSIYEEPKNEAEKIVAEIWQELLGIQLVGVHDNFFELGGHSLIATRLISRLREIFRIDIPLPTLFDRPTVREVVENVIHTWGDGETVEEIARTYREVQDAAGILSSGPKEEI